MAANWDEQRDLLNDDDGPYRPKRKGWWTLPANRSGAVPGTDKVKRSRCASAQGLQWLTEREREGVAPELCKIGVYATDTRPPSLLEPLHFLICLTCLTEINARSDRTLRVPVLRVFPCGLKVPITHHPDRSIRPRSWLLFDNRLLLPFSLSSPTTHHVLLMLLVSSLLLPSLGPTLLCALRCQLQ
jgi:hypothetical protein